jgi:hypothetical protein
LVGGLFHFQHDRSAAISFAELGGLPSALDGTFGSDFKIAITKGFERSRLGWRSPSRRSDAPEPTEKSRPGGARSVKNYLIVSSAE